jgi:phage repressor protein C with HTH and peptisase S24 domain
MSEKQAEKRSRGRPVNEQRFSLPIEMEQALEGSTFFNLEAGRAVRWRGLPDASGWERKYRFRAAIRLLLSRGFKPNMSEKYLEKSWKQVSRYLDGEEAPASFIDALATIADISEAWLLSGDPGVNARVAEAFEEMGHHAPLLTSPMIDRIVDYERGALEPDDKPRQAEIASQKENTETAKVSRKRLSTQQVAEVRSADETRAPNFAVRGLNHEMISRIRAEIDRLGSKTVVAKEAGVPLGTLNETLAGKAEPPFSVVTALARRFGRSVEWLERGEENSSLAASDDYVAIPRYEMRISAGRGAVVEGAGEASELLMFRASWVRSLGLNPKLCHIITVEGQSMEPTLYEDDIILVNTAERRPTSNGIFAIAVDDRALVKRIQLRHDGSVILVGDNKHERDEIIPSDQVADLRIIGRVRWYARTLR